MEEKLVDETNITEFEEEEKKCPTIFYILIIVIPILMIILLVVIIILKSLKIDMIKDYDFYIFQIRNPRVECLRDKKGNTCLEKYNKLPNGTLSIHGLWPSILNKPVTSYMNINCTDKNIKIKNDGSDLYKQLEIYWINESNIDIWEHEYIKHGYCYNVRVGYDENNYTFYFNDTFQFYEKYDFKNLITSNFTADEKGYYNFNYSDLNNIIKEKFGKKGYITCYKENDIQHIYEIGFALNLKFQFIEHEGSEPTGKIKCDENKTITLVNSNFTVKD